MLTTRTGAMAAQTQAQLDDENVLNHVLQTIMGFPMDSEVKQALTNAGVRSIVDLFTMEIDLLSQLTYKVGTEREFAAPGCFQAEKSPSLP